MKSNEALGKGNLEGEGLKAEWGVAVGGKQDAAIRQGTAGSRRQGEKS